MAFERFDMKNESYGERHTKIVDCHGLQFLCSTSIYLYATKDEYHGNSLYATKDDYHGNSSPKTYSTSRPPLPHPPRGYYPQAVGMGKKTFDVPLGNQVPNLTKRLEVPQTARKPIMSDEAAKLFGGILITEYRNKKQHRA